MIPCGTADTLFALDVLDVYKGIRKAMDMAKSSAQLLGPVMALRKLSILDPLEVLSALGSEARLKRYITRDPPGEAKIIWDIEARVTAFVHDRRNLVVDLRVRAVIPERRTPLVIAAAHDGNIEVIRLLISRGSDVKAPGPAGVTAALGAATLANDTTMTKFLVEQGADIKAKGPAGFTALMAAASYGNVELVKLFLAGGSDVNAQSEPNFGRPVKNGPIAIGSLTALLFAVPAGSPETVRLLLDAGADVNVRDVRGMTPIMLAVATDHPNEKIVRMLLARRTDVNVKSKANETALDGAVKFQNPSILRLIRNSSPGVELARRETVAPTLTIRDAREAVEKSVGLLQKSTVTFLREGGCVSCHAQNITSIAVAAARAKGLRVDEAAATEVARGTRLS
jgi:ankyrin repeat protein